MGTSTNTIYRFTTADPSTPCFSAIFPFLLSLSLFLSLYLYLTHAHILTPFIQPRITFGSGGDIKPLSLTVAQNHCVVFKEQDNAAAAATPPAAGEEEGEGGGGGADNAPSPATYALECGDGETYVNGR